MAVDFDIRDPKNQKLIMTFLIPVVILYGFFHFFIKPKMEELNSTKEQVEEIRVRIDTTQAALQSKEKLTEAKRNLLKKSDELEKLLPEEENVAVLLKQFSMVEKDTNVFVVGFDAIETQVGADRPYRTNEYRVTIEAGYHQFGMFMSRIMALPRLLSFKSLNIILNPMATEMKLYEGMESQPRHLTIEFTLTSYVFIDLDAGSEDEKS